jgi:hypothetical protein
MRDGLVDHGAGGADGDDDFQPLDPFQQSGGFRSYGFGSRRPAPLPPELSLLEGRSASSFSTRPKSYSLPRRGLGVARIGDFFVRLQTEAFYQAVSPAPKRR